MDPAQVKQLIDASMNDIVWYAAGIGVAIFLKNALENLVWCITFLIGRDYCVDDEVVINGRKGRIARQTMTKTVFYMYDNNSRLVVPNSQLHSLRCEKLLLVTEVNDEQTQGNS